MLLLLTVFLDDATSSSQFLKIMSIVADNEEIEFEVEELFGDVAVVGEKKAPLSTIEIALDNDTTTTTTTMTFDQSDAVDDTGGVIQQASIELAIELRNLKLPLDIEQYIEIGKQKELFSSFMHIKRNRNRKRLWCGGCWFEVCEAKCNADSFVDRRR